MSRILVPVGRAVLGGEMATPGTYRATSLTWVKPVRSSDSPVITDTASGVFWSVSLVLRAETTIALGSSFRLAAPESAAASAGLS